MRRFAMPAVAGSVLLGLVCAGCAAGPSTAPHFAVAGHTDGTPGSTTPAAPPAPPQAEQPRNRIAWRPCRDDPAAGLPPGPAGMTLECATIRGDKDPDTTAAGIPIDLARASVPSTPDDAAPVVLVSGTGESSRRALATLATGEGATLLETHPVVSIDRRGLGPSTDPDCFAGTDAADLTAAGRGGDPAARTRTMMSVVDRITVSCTDLLRPSIDAFDAVHAASDIDALRTYWGVERIDLLTLGDGSDAALAYEANAPGHLARLIMDSPGPLRVDAQTVAERRAQADEAALARFVSDCAALGCAAGPDAAGTLHTVLDSAEAGLIRGVSTGSVLTVVRRTLSEAATAWDDRVARLGDLLHGAATGDVGALHVFADASAETSGSFVARCSDAPPPATPDQSQKAQADWAGKYPVFGTDAAVRMLTCASWPSHDAPAAPGKISVPVLLFSGSADPVVGAGSVDPVTAALARAGTRFATVHWDGVGHGALWGTSCAADRLGAYLDDAALPADGTACPA